MMPESSPSAADSPTSLSGLGVLVVGLGRFGGGVGVTRWLASQGAIVTVTDHAGGEELAESVQAVADLDVDLHLGGHDLCDLDTADLVVINPAVRKTRSKLFQEIVRRKIAWTTEMNLFCQRCPGRVVAVTGTYGKSTTCAMLAGALEACFRAGDEATGVHLGGNIGRSLLPELDTIAPTDLVVLEMSSAQLEDLSRINWAPAVAVITNISPHHLDRYATYAEYVAVKLNIIGSPQLTDTVIVGEMDAEAEAIFRRKTIDSKSGCQVLRVSRADPPAELCVPGEHNRANAACVLEICHHLKLDQAVARDALRSFKGLPHRLEYVRTLDGVDYFNDSKSTSPAATTKAVEALNRPIVLIVGGQEVRRAPNRAPGASPVTRDTSRRGGLVRGLAPAARFGAGEPSPGSLSVCAEILVRKCRLVICIGQSGPAFARAVSMVQCRLSNVDSKSACSPIVIQQSTFDNSSGLLDAVRHARAEARPGDVVLFSPGAPSFDAYANFADRGRHFLDVMNSLS